MVKGFACVHEAGQSVIPKMVGDNCPFREGYKKNKTLTHS